MTDITDTLAPNSDQLDAIELIAGPRTFTITAVDVKAGAEQPVSVHFANFPRPWKPGKSMRRVLAACWGADSSVWIGRRVTLYFDPEVTFGKDKPGGTRIRALSHLERVEKVPLLVSRGRSANYIVEPLPTEPAVQSLTDAEVDAELANIAACSTAQEIGDLARRIAARLPEHRAAEVKQAAADRRAALTQPQQGTLDGEPITTGVIQRDGEPS